MCRLLSDGNRSPTYWLYYPSQAIGTQAQVADLLAVTARTVQRRERGAMPITREAWLAIEMLSASPLYAPVRHLVNA